MAGKSMLLKTVIAIAGLSILLLALNSFMPGNRLFQAGPAAMPEHGSATVCFQSACVNAELAETREERSQGLMFREHLGEGEGMLFVFETESIHSFWMKNTLIPLDMIWIGKDMKIVHVEHAVPCTTESCRSYTPSAPALYVLETNAGSAEKNGIRVGNIATIDYS